jgi:hypothetical protein
MYDESPAVAFGVVSGDGLIAADVPCTRCQYNVRMLSPDGLCPECAQPVATSLTTFLQRLRFADPAWVRRLARGLACLLLTVVIALGVPVVVGALAVALGAPFRGDAPMDNALFRFALFMQCTWFVELALGLTGVVLFTRREPGRWVAPERRSARKLARGLLWFIPLQLIVLVATVVLVPMPEWFEAPLGRTAFLASPIGYALQIANTVLFVPLFVLLPLVLLRHLTTLLQRVPAPALQRFARIEFWGLLITGAVVLALLVISMFVIYPTLAPYIPTPTTTSSAPTTAPSPREYVVSSRVRLTPFSVTASMPASFPATMPAPGPMRVPTRGFMLTMLLGALSGCGMVVFAVAGVILLVLAYGVLRRAAREAQEQAADRDRRRTNAGGNVGDPHVSETGATQQG